MCQLGDKEIQLSPTVFNVLLNHLQESYIDSLCKIPSQRMYKNLIPPQIAINE